MRLDNVSAPTHLTGETVETLFLAIVMLQP